MEAPSFQVWTSPFFFGAEIPSLARLASIAFFHRWGLWFLAFCGSLHPQRKENPFLITSFILQLSFYSFVATWFWVLQQGDHERHFWSIVGIPVCNQSWIWDLESEISGRIEVRLGFETCSGWPTSKCDSLRSSSHQDNTRSNSKLSLYSKRRHTL